MKWLMEHRRFGHGDKSSNIIFVANYVAFTLFQYKSSNAAVSVDLIPQQPHPLRVQGNLSIITIA